MFSKGSKYPCPWGNRGKTPDVICLTYLFLFFEKERNLTTNCPSYSCFLTAPRLHVVPFPFSFFSLPELLRRHAARLRRFLSSPDPDAAFTACGEKNKHPTPQLSTERMDDVAQWMLTSHPGLFTFKRKTNEEYGFYRVYRATFKTLGEVRLI